MILSSTTSGDAEILQLVGAVATSSAISATPSASPVSASASSAAATSSADAKLENGSPGISTGAKAGIGAAVGGAALIALVLSLIFWKKRRQQPQNAQPQHAQPPELAYIPTEKYEMCHDSALKHELPSADMVEVPSNERPVELPGHMPQRIKQHP